MSVENGFGLVLGFHLLVCRLGDLFLVLSVGDGFGLGLESVVGFSFQVCPFGDLSLCLSDERLRLSLIHI